MNHRIPFLFGAVAPVFLGLVSTAVAGEYPYLEETNIVGTDTNWGSAPIFADMDADGDQDIVVVGYDAIFWFENTDGTADGLTERAVEPGQTDVDDAEVVDFDGDGDLDVISSGGGLKVHENLGEGKAWQTHVVDEDAEGMLAVGDLDGDGDLDAAITRPSLEWFENPGTTEGWSGLPVAGAPSYIEVVATGDFDGDGMDELLAGGEDSFVRMTYDGGPWQTTVLDPQSGLYDLNVADIDDDGDLDVLAGMHRHAVLMTNDGTGLLLPDTLEDSGQLVVEYRMAAADVEGNGDLDIVMVTHAAEGAVRWFEPVGGGYEAHLVRDTWYDSPGFSVADLDCDGDAEIVAGGYDAAWFLRLWDNATTAPTGDEQCEAPSGGDDGGEGDSGGDGEDDSGGETEDGDTDGGDESGGDDAGDGTGGAAGQDDEAGGPFGCSVSRAPSGGLVLGLLGLLGLRRRRRRG